MKHQLKAFCGCVRSRQSNPNVMDQIIGKYDIFIVKASVGT